LVKSGGAGASFQLVQQFVKNGFLEKRWSDVPNRMPSHIWEPEGIFLAAVPPFTKHSPWTSVVQT
jgi:hypothetical protein